MLQAVRTAAAVAGNALNKDELPAALGTIQVMRHEQSAHAVPSHRLSGTGGHRPQWGHAGGLFSQPTELEAIDLEGGVAEIFWRIDPMVHMHHRTSGKVVPACSNVCRHKHSARVSSSLLSP